MREDVALGPSLRAERDPASDLLSIDDALRRFATDAHPIRSPLSISKILLSKGSL